MGYTIKSNVHIVETPASSIKILMVDKAKNTAATKDYCNAGFFANYKEAGEAFTLPVGHLVCDYKADSKHTKKYCTERGAFSGSKYKFDSGKWEYMNHLYGNEVSTLIVKNKKANIEDIKYLPECDYAISGIPIIRDGEDVTFKTYVKGQGWDATPLYATYHIFVGIKSKNTDVLSIICMRTSTVNMITSAEAYRKFKELGYLDVIKLDGGGSTILNVDGIKKVATSKNRRINTILTFRTQEENEEVHCPGISVPTIKRGYKGKSTKSAQILLNGFGFNAGSADGIFGSGTESAVKRFQKKFGLPETGVLTPEDWEILITQKSENSN